MQIFDQAPSYATRANAERKIRKVFGAAADSQRWFVIAQADGRFTPCVVRDSGNGNVGACHQRICVVG